jgi:hypothetical protein
MPSQKAKDFVNDRITTHKVRGLVRPGITKETAAVVDVAAWP